MSTKPRKPLYFWTSTFYRIKRFAAYKDHVVKIHLIGDIESMLYKRFLLE